MTSKEIKTVFEEINNYIKSKGIRKAHLARVTGIDPSVLSQQLNGRTKPKKYFYKLLCYELGIEPKKFG
jgi:transcriptional regulator with XRE-family HTH domain